MCVLRDMELIMREGLHLCVQCTCVHLLVFTWPRSVWVFVCLLVSLCGRGAEGTWLLSSAGPGPSSLLF